MSEDNFTWACCDCEKKYYTINKPEKCDNCGCTGFMDKDCFDAAHGLSDFSPRTKELFAKYDNVPKCPTCGSKNVEPISTTRKIGGLLTLGLASKSVGKSYRCKNCNYYW